MAGQRAIMTCRYDVRPTPSVSSVPSTGRSFSALSDVGRTAPLCRLSGWTRSPASTTFSPPSSIARPIHQLFNHPDGDEEGLQRLPAFVRLRPIVARAPSAPSLQQPLLFTMSPSAADDATAATAAETANAAAQVRCCRPAPLPVSRDSRTVDEMGRRIGVDRWRCWRQMIGGRPLGSRATRLLGASFRAGHYFRRRRSISRLTDSDLRCWRHLLANYSRSIAFGRFVGVRGFCGAIS